ncbi:hypothetical protein GCM10009544_27550 [Streptomyces stramineus]|uniref:Uncharacterized protein n=1 Tax=Streptomyces stramineus TaxID=173861 RepID=A0ABN0ZZ50_9ACTN
MVRDHKLWVAAAIKPLDLVPGGQAPRTRVGPLQRGTSLRERTRAQPAGGAGATLASGPDGARQRPAGPGPGRGEPSEAVSEGYRNSPN